MGLQYRRSPESGMESWATNTSAVHWSITGVVVPRWLLVQRFSSHPVARDLSSNDGAPADEHQLRQLVPQPAPGHYYPAAWLN